MTSISSSSGSSGLSSYFSSKINDLFSKVDTSGDDQISLSEFEAVGQNVPGSASQTGNSSTVSQNSDAASQFKQIDTNGDGQLSKDEVTSYVQQQLNQRQTALTNIQELFGGGGSSKAHGHGGGHHHKSSTGSSDQSTDSTSGSNSTDPLSALLSALNGASSSSSSSDSTSSDNSDDPLSSLFSSIDSNGDGSVSKDELSSYIDQQKASLTAASSNLQGLFSSTSQASNNPPPPPPQDDNSISAVNGSSSSSSSSTSTNDPLQQLYSALDSNSDGSISKTELASYLSRYQQNAAAA